MPRIPHAARWRLQHDSADRETRTTITGSHARRFDEFVLQGVAHVEALDNRLYMVRVGDGWLFTVHVRPDGTASVSLDESPTEVTA